MWQREATRKLNQEPAGREKSEAGRTTDITITGQRRLIHGQVTTTLLICVAALIVPVT